jgi:photosystem II stability/assembly factor-like uncharacterized protein
MIRTPIRWIAAPIAVLACAADSPGDEGTEGPQGSTADTAGIVDDGAPASSTTGGLTGPITDSSGAHDSSTGVIETGEDTTGVDPVGDVGPLITGQWVDITVPGIDPSQTPCTDLQFDPSHAGTLVAFYGTLGVFKSTDWGGSWTAIGDLPTPASLGRIRIDPGDASHMYATGSVEGSSLGFWVTNDGGETWTMPEAFTAGAVAGTWNTDVYNIVVDPTDFDHVLLGFHSPWACCGEDAGIVESTDGGATFVAHAPMAGMNHAQGVAFLFDPSNGIGNANTWLVGGGYEPGLYRTDDAGSSWTHVDDLHDSHGGFDAHYSAQGYVYIGGEGAIFRSTDNGLTWEAENGDGGVPYNWYYGVIGDGEQLYTSAAFVGVDENMPMLVAPEGGPDEGRVWTAFNDQILPAGPWRMVFDPVHRVIYDATWNGGAWALSLGE